MNIRERIYIAISFRNLARDCDGVSSVEFAFILPIMLALLIGGVEVGNALASNYKVSSAAYTVADLASQFVTIQSSDMTNILAASSVIIAPYSSSGLVVTVSEVTTSSAGQATVTWSASTGTARPVGQAITLPTAFSSLPSNTSLILGEATYAYNPAIGYVLTGTINLADSYYLYPRLSDCVTYNNVCS